MSSPAIHVLPRRTPGVWWLAILPAAACGVRELPPPEAPAALVPKVDFSDAPAPAPGQTTVVLDTLNGPARVARVTQVFGTSGDFARLDANSRLIATSPLCARTPCVVSVPPGLNMFVFHHVNDDGVHGQTSVDVGRKPVVVRHTMEEHTSGGTARQAGAWLAMGGFFSAAVGGVMWVVDNHATDRDGVERNTGRTLTIVGLAGLGIGFTMAIADPPTFRPSATTSFQLEQESPSQPRPAPPGFVSASL